jgi:hypothetical protein
MPDLVVDGLLDDWKSTRVAAHQGGAPDALVELHCAWDGGALAFGLDIKDDKIVRVNGKAHEDRVTIKVRAGNRALEITRFPANTLAKAKQVVTGARLADDAVADSLQPKGFSLEAHIPANAIPEFTTSTPALHIDVTFHDSDAATGGADHDVTIASTLELAERKDLLDDFLATTHLGKADLKLDTLAELDPDRPGKERLVAGGTVIGILTDQFAFVTLPGEPKKLELLALGPRGQQIISAVVRQTGNGGARELLMLWTVWSGQLQPLAQIEVKKELGGNVLESSWKIVKGKGPKPPELVVEPQPAIGFSADTWNDTPA